jgi:hypothetical protein
MNHYKLREGESIRKPVVKRTRIEIRVPVLLICLALAFLIWLYMVSFSKIDPTAPLDGPVDTEQGSDEAVCTDPDQAEVDQLLFAVMVDGLGGMAQ